MEKTIIVSDFDGTITTEDTLYKFFKVYAESRWLEIEKMWAEGKIGSAECLVRQFELVDNLDENLVDKFTSEIKLDPYFKDFINNNDKDFIVVSDGVDYFINKIFENHGINNIKIISNHAEFIKGKFTLSFPNKNNKCKNKSGTCKCAVVNSLKEKYNNIIYIGDGQSDFCVANKADILYAKGSLLNYCRKNNLKHKEFKGFKDILSL